MRSRSLAGAVLFAGGLSLLAPAFGAPPAKPEPTAAGYPAWTGVTESHRITGRVLTPSDLRQRYTVIAVIDGTKFKEQFPEVLRFNGYNKITEQGSIETAWEHLELYRETICLISVVGGNPKKILEEYEAHMKADKTAGVHQIPPIVYMDVTFAGAPDADGKYPFVYAMGPVDDKPIFSGDVEAAKKDLSAAIRKAKAATEGEAAQLGIWKPYFGYCTDPKSCATLKKALLAGKPLDGALAQAQKGVRSKDPQKAKDCQTIYDAINQARSDLLLRIELEAPRAPYRAAYDIAVLLRQFPKEKKRVSEHQARIKKNPEIARLGKIFSQVMTWNDPDFTPKSEGEAKKIVGQLEALKKQIVLMKESTNTFVQNGACVLETDIEDLIAAIPTRVPSK